MTHIKIAICDQETATCGSLESMIQNISAILNFRCDIDVFSNGKELCQRLTEQRNAYHLLFLEIELPNMSGIEAGTYIRETLNDHNTEIAFISYHTNNAMRLFKLRPINFLTKPLTSEQVSEVMKTFLELKQLNRSKYHFKKGRERYSIAYSDILYFEHSGRKVMIHTNYDVFEHYASLDEIYNKVKNEPFLLVHKSFLVNYNYIFKYSYQQLIMTNHAIIPISQSKRPEIQTKFITLYASELDAP